ncbi:Beta-catenin [Parasponia andersonii]|uniref:RING-type E3 ubiquitin transferase n=1 Tax=Parasponia andersonii TaxID=3476 RepID=A0A2P5DTE5_PARAD|nr:Beta-catenin [Parasponia andersonii]
MAEVTENDPSSMVAEKTLELKNELQRLVKALIEDEDHTVEDETFRVLSSLKCLKFKKSLSFKLDDSLIVPNEFKCPISKELMTDPVVLATGLTYDRPFIERWLIEGHNTCPQTRQVLPHTVLTPNHLVQEMISQWCTEHGIELPRTSQDVDDKVIRAVDEGYLNSLLEKLSSSLSDQKEAAKDIRLLSKRTPSIREYFGRSTEAIPKLLNPLTPGDASVHPDLQEDLITTLLNLSIYEDNKKIVGENPLAITLLVESLISGTTQTKSNAAAALFTLSNLDSNKLIIGNSGALKSLIDLLEEDGLQVIKDAASAIFSLCICHENKRMAIKDGAVSMIVKKMKENILVGELLAILALLSAHQLAIDEMNKINVMPLLLGIIRESTCEKSKENAIAIVHTLVCNDRKKLREIKVEEANNASISKLSRTGTARARRKAMAVLERLDKGVFITHTA